MQKTVLDILLHLKHDKIFCHHCFCMSLFVTFVENVLIGCFKNNISLTEQYLTLTLTEVTDIIQQKGTVMTVTDFIFIIL